MTTIQTIVALILTPTLIVSGFVFVLRKFFEQLLSRDIKKFEARLRAESEQSKLRLEKELQARLFEFQTKFSIYHQKQVDVIETLYEKLWETELIVGQLVHPVRSSDGRTQEEQVREAYDKKVDLARFFNRKRIYLDDDICVKMDTLVRAMQKAVVKFDVSQMEPRSNAEADMRMWSEAWKVMEEEVPPIRKALEIKLKQILIPLAG